MNAVSVPSGINVTSPNNSTSSLCSEEISNGKETYRTESDKTEKEIRVLLSEKNRDRRVSCSSIVGNVAGENEGLPEL